MVFYIRKTNAIIWYYFLLCQKSKNKFILKKVGFSLNPLIFNNCLHKQSFLFFVKLILKREEVVFVFMLRVEKDIAKFLSLAYYLRCIIIQHKSLLELNSKSFFFNSKLGIICASLYRLVLVRICASQLL